MSGIYKIINSYFEEILEVYGYKISKLIKSNIHPSVLYSHKNGIYEIQIGYNYEESVTFANMYGKKVSFPQYNKDDKNLTIKLRLYEYSKILKAFLQSSPLL